jgi:nucleotide-binding universal stress UspA family protein
MRVLIATDGSDSAARAIELAGSIKWPADTELRVVTVVQPVEPVLYSEWASLGNHNSSYSDEAAAEATSILESATRRLAKTGLDITQRKMYGRAATEIVRHADEAAADLIIVGSRGHGRIGSMILGSVAAEVSDHASCPVLVARSTALTRAVLAVDGSPFSEDASDVVAALRIFDNVAIEVANIADTHPALTALAVGNFAATTDDVESATLADHRQIAEETVSRLRIAGRAASATVLRGVPAYEILRIAQEKQADLIVVATHGRTGLERVLLGSVARNVLFHSKCSVLLVRPSRAAVRRAAA